MQLEMILSEFGQKQFLQVWTNLWNRKYTYALGNNLSQFAPICATGNPLMLLETVLCEFGQICATGNAFARLTADRNYILNFPAKI